MYIYIYIYIYICTHVYIGTLHLLHSLAVSSSASRQSCFCHSDSDDVPGLNGKPRNITKKNNNNNNQCRLDTRVTRMETRCMATPPAPCLWPRALLGAALKEPENKHLSEQNCAVLNQ